MPLSYSVIKLTSVTYAVRAQKVLQQHGIKSYVKKQSSNMQSGGCSYGIEVRGDANTAAYLIRNAGIKVVSIE